MARAVCLFAVAGLLLSGCSDEAADMPELGYVQGVVTLDSQPLKGVTIYFKPEVGRPSLGKADESGHYKAMYRIDKEGVKVGPNRVHLEWGLDDSGPKIPAAFGAKSDLKLEVKPGKNEFNIDAVSTTAKK
ncbi:hypothetical protein Pan44_03770 [Caulifigura coniformis]|uniref:Nickel uptake substrate-specific transmembrane region n=1 Tax=Caulifigura coniformis TaxID=2527983 RepID=A0A517S8B1_9PLAN|nr:hypothetical protein [Caulifigura coniformis]QDT52367.1 hypothetical protein Pan44_03770 [Caulifigura coniformis]